MNPLMTNGVHLCSESIPISLFPQICKLITYRKREVNNFLFCLTGGESRTRSYRSMEEGIGKMREKHSTKCARTGSNIPRIFGPRTGEVSYIISNFNLL